MGKGRRKRNKSGRSSKRPARNQSQPVETVAVPRSRIRIALALGVILLLIGGGVYFRPAIEKKEDVVAGEPSQGEPINRTIENQVIAEHKLMVVQFGDVEISMVPEVFSLADFGEPDKLIALDNRLAKHWGMPDTKEWISAALNMIRFVHGKFYLRGSFVGVYWDQENKLGLKEHLPGVGAMTLKCPDQKSVWIVFISDDPKLYMLPHELSHANILYLDTPLLLNEGISTYTQIITDGMVIQRAAQGAKAHPGKVIFELANGRSKAMWSEYLLQCEYFDKPGIQPTEFGPEHFTDLAFWQYMLSAWTFFVLEVEGVMETNGQYRPVADYLDWINRSKSLTLQDSAAYLRSRHPYLRKPHKEKFVIFDEPPAGLFAFVVPTGAPREFTLDQEQTVSEVSLLIINRDERRLLKPEPLRVRTNKTDRALLQASGADLIPLGELGLENQDEITISRVSDPSVSVVIPHNVVIVEEGAIGPPKHGR